MAETELHSHPEMGTILKTDANARGNYVEETEFNRALQHTKFPFIRGPEKNYDYPSFQVSCAHVKMRSFYYNGPELKYFINTMILHIHELAITADMLYRNAKRLLFLGSLYFQSYSVQPGSDKDNQ